MSLRKGPNGNKVEVGECIRNSGYLEDCGGTAEHATEENRKTSQDSTVDLPEDAVEGAYTQIKPYAGMPKEVLLMYSCQNRYRLPREFLFWLTIACTLVLIALTITAIAFSPRCLSWWQSSPVYQVYPRSFKDSDGDGVGDLRGIKEKLDHFQYLNIKAVWISPFYRSPMKDFGYDVEDFREIDPLFGSMEDFDDLLASMHDRGLKVIMDFIPNHTSDRHRWFNLSRSQDEHYRDYYVWADCNSTMAPNNWVSVFGNSSWTYDAERKQCYLHQFLKEQPDLNMRNPIVRQEIVDIIHYWLEKGVDGFRMDAVKHMLEAKHLRNEPQVDPNKPPTEVTTEWDLFHDYTYSQVGLHDILRGWRTELDRYSREPERYRVMVTESYDYEEVDKTMMYYGTPQAQESDIPFNFYLLDLPQNMTGWWVQHLVDLWMSNMPAGKWPNWVVGNHDRTRIASSAGRSYASVINMLLLTLPGTPTTYYGEELGMENINITQSQIQDPAGKYNISASRDPQRSPMQWSNTSSAGFSDNTSTWLPLHPDYSAVNVETQKMESDSVLAQYRFLSLMRESELPLHRGWLCYVHRDANVFVYLREMDGLNKAFLIVLNFGKDAAVTDLDPVKELPDRLTVRMGTDGRKNGKVLQKSSIATATGEGLLLEYSTHVRFNPTQSTQCYISEKACYLPVLDLLYKC